MLCLGLFNHAAHGSTAVLAHEKRGSTLKSATGVQYFLISNAKSFALLAS